MARSSETRRQHADWDAEVTGMLRELSGSRGPESVRRAVDLVERLAAAGRYAHQEKVREALDQTIEKHPKDVFESFGLGEVYEKSATGQLSSKDCRAVAAAFKRAHDFLRYPMMEILMGSIADLETCDRLLDAARYWPWQGKSAEQTTGSTLACHELWKLMRQFRTACAAEVAGEAVRLGLRVVEQYASIHDVLDTWSVGDLRAQFRGALTDVLKVLGRYKPENAAQCVEMLAEDLRGAGRASLAAEVEKTWSKLGSRATPPPADSAAAPDSIFKKEGATWLLVYGGLRRTVADSVGMACIGRLLQSPGQEIHAAELRSADDVKSGTLGSAGEVLDAQALREYDERLRDIDREVNEAAANADLGRKESLLEEREQLRQQLRRATGLGGRKRKASDDRERARQSVSVAIHRALRTIQKEHEPLWHHLRNSLKVGEFLSYRPDGPTPWAT